MAIDLMVAAMRLGALLVGVASATPVLRQTEQGSCTQLAAPQNVSAVFWNSTSLSSRRVTAYEFAATWARVPGAQDYTICYTQEYAHFTVHVKVAWQTNRNRF